MSAKRGAMVGSAGPRVDPAQQSDVTQLTYTVGELARALRLSRTLTYASLRDGTIPAERAGRRWVISRRRIQRWLDGGGSVGGR